MTPSIYLSIPNLYAKDIGMVSCSFLCLSCKMTPCFLLFHVLSHPYIPLHFEEMIFPLVCFSICVIRSLWNTWVLFQNSIVTASHCNKSFGCHTFTLRGSKNLLKVHYPNTEGIFLLCFLSFLDGHLLMRVWMLTACKSFHVQFSNWLSAFVRIGFSECDL